MRLAFFTLAIGYLIYCALVLTQQDRFIFRRVDCDPALPAGQPPSAAQSIWINVGTGQAPIPVEAWYFAPNPLTNPRAPAVMFFHGTGDLIDESDPRVDGWRRRGWAVLLPEYRGYGRSAGEPSQSALVADACRFYDWLASRPEIDPSRIILHGVSLGGGVATEVAARRGARALILESTFTSVARFFPAHLAPPALCTSPFPNDRTLPTLALPVLIFHGADDATVPVSEGRRLHALCPASTYVELPGHHDDFPLAWKPYWSSVDRFARSLTPRGRRAAPFDNTEHPERPLAPIDGRLSASG